MDIGRNDPCSCGSGKKYKRCCGLPQADPLADAAKAIRAVQAEAEKKVLRFLREEMDEDLLYDTWEDFDVTEGKLKAGTDEDQLFFPWVLYDWEPWEAEETGRRPAGARLTPSAMAAATDGVLSAEESDLVMQITTTPTSFHDVIAVEPGRTVTLRDILLGTELIVYETSGSSQIGIDDIFYARAVQFEGAALLIGCGQLVLPPGCKGAILDVRKRLRTWRRTLPTERLCDGEMLLRSSYLQLRESIVHPALPTITNTDGDLMLFRTLHYRIDNPDKAFESLIYLAIDLSRGDILAEAERNRDGTLRRATFSLSKRGSAKHAGAPNTILATFTIDGTDLTVDVNSASRARAARAEIKKLLGERATFVKEDVRSIGDMMREAESKPETAKQRTERLRNEELQAQPEVQALLAKMNADHYATWPDVPLPALKGKTPRAAMRSKDGREIVAALIADFERSQEKGHASPRYDFNQLRDALGLPPRERRRPRSDIPPSRDAE